MERGFTPSTPADRAPRLPLTRSQATTRNGRVTDEVEQVIEPTIRVVGRPLVQLGLDLQYPRLGLIEARPRCVGVHRRPPGIPVPSLRSCCPPSPCGRLSRPRTTTRTSAPSPAPSADDGPARRRPGWPAGRATPRWFPRSPCTGRRGRCPALPLQPRHGYAAGLPRGLPTGGQYRLRSRLTVSTADGVHCCPAHIHQVGAGSHA